MSPKRLYYSNVTGHISLDKENERLRIVFPYDPELVDLVKRIPGRRWDHGRKEWTIPKGQAREALRVLLPRGFTASPEVEELGARDAGEPGILPETALTISELNEMARNSIHVAFPSPLWLVGELQRIQKNPNGHCFLEMVEKMEGSEGIKASVQGVVFSEDLEFIEKKLKDKGDLQLAQGLEVRVLVKPDIFPERGRYQVIWKDIDPVFTLGKLAARREEILKELAKAGLLNKNKDLPWPDLPLRIGLITSWESNAFHDFYGVLKKSGFSFQVHCFDARVQGRDLEQDVLQGLQWFKERSKDFDVLAIVRGGGSRADLAWFDNLEIAVAVATHPLKIIVGIGHTQDITVLDIIAHSARSPTEAGKQISERVETWLEERQKTWEATLYAARELIGIERSETLRKARRLLSALRSRVREERNTLRRRNRTVVLFSLRTFREARAELVKKVRILRKSALHIIEKETRFLSQSSAVASSHDPMKILEKGFALVKGSDGSVKDSIRKINQSEIVEVQLFDGLFQAEVTRKDEKEKERGNG